MGALVTGVVVVIGLLILFDNAFGSRFSDAWLIISLIRGSSRGSGHPPSGVGDRPRPRERLKAAVSGMCAPRSPGILPPVASINSQPHP